MATPGPGAMSAGGVGGGGVPDGNWRAPNFRAKVVGQINDALRDACNPIEKSGSELEEHIFNRSRDRDNYLSLVARLILHMRDSTAAKEKGLTGRMTPNMPGQQQDPMVALQGLTQIGQTHSPGGPGLQMQPNPGQMVPGVNPGQRPMLRNQMSQPPPGGAMIDQRQQQQLQKIQKMMSTPPSQAGPMPGTSMHQVVSQAPPQSQPSQMPHYQGGAGMQGGGFSGGGGGNMTPQPQPGVMGGVPPGGPGGQMHMQGGQMGMQPGGMMPQQMQQMTRPQQTFQNQMVMSSQTPQAQIQTRPQVSRTYSGQPTPPVQSVVTDSPVYNRQQPSPAQQSQPGPTPGSNPMHSPASYFQPSPSPQAHSIPSPASAGSQRGGPPSVPSPSSTLNTPGNPGSVGGINPSPGGGMRGGPGSNQSQPEVVLYQEKLRQLTKYIEPLKKAIQVSANREDGGTQNPADLKKLKGLLDIITNQNSQNAQRLTYGHLVKCEQYLENFEQQFKQSTSTSVSTPTTITATTAPGRTTLTADSRPAVKTNMFQPLLDAVKANINSPSINHSLQRTFGPALTTLRGAPSHFPCPPSKKQKTESDASPTTQIVIPNIVQGEVARLAPKFRVNLDPMFHSSGKDVHLVCRLDDKHLPSVPPINIAIPEQYPKISPFCEMSAQDYNQTPFLKLVFAGLQNQLTRLPERFTLTQILDLWEMSIRKSCLTMTTARDAS